MEWVLFVILALIFGIVLGYQIALKKYEKKVAGTLRVDRSDPDEQPYLFLELMREGYEQIQKQDIVTFRVSRENYVPRE